MEAMTAFGFELIDPSVTTSKGAMLVSSCVKVYKNKNFGATFPNILFLKTNIFSFVLAWYQNKLISNYKIKVGTYMQW